MQRTDGGAGWAVGSRGTEHGAGECRCSRAWCSKGKQSGEVINLPSRLVLKLFIYSTSDTAKGSRLRANGGT